MLLPTRLGRPPKPRLRILHRYLLREIASPAFLAFLMYTFVMLMNWFFVIAEYAYKYQVPVRDLWVLFAYQLPHVVVLTVPISLLVGLLVATARLAADSELTALGASGLSIVSLLRPVLGLAVVFATLTGWLTFEVMPRGNYASTRLTFEIFRQNLLRQVKPREFNSRSMPGYSFYIGSIDHGPEGELWRGVLLEPTPVPSARSPLREVYFAGEAWPAVDEEAGAIILTLQDVSVHSMRAFDGGSYDARRLKEYSRRLPPPPLFRKASESGMSKTQREMTLAELLTELQLKRGESAFLDRLLGLEIHKRFSIPCACFVFAFLGLGLGATAGRSGRSFGFVVSLVIILCYYLLFYAGERMAVSGTIKPWLSMWAGNLLFGVIGVLLFLERASGGRFFGRWRRIGWRVPRPLRRRVTADRTSSRGSRRGLPRLIDRYLVGEFARVFALVMASAVGLFVVVSLSQILNDIVRNDVPLRTVVSYYVAWFPEILSYVLPVTALITTVVTFSLLTRTNEITAMLVNGISLYRLVLPVLVAGLALALGSLVLYDTVGARAAQRWDELNDEIQGYGPRPWITGSHWAELSDGRTYLRFDAYDPAAAQFYRVSLFQLGADAFTPSRHVYAPRARWQGGSLLLDQGWEREFEGSAQTRYARFETRHWPFIESRTDFARQWDEPKHLDNRELEDYIRFRKRRGLGALELEIDLWSRHAMPFVTLVMVILGLPFAFTIGKRGSLYGIGIAIAIAVVYWSTLVFMAYLGKLGILATPLAAWGPNLVFALLGSAAFLNLRT